MKTFKATPTRIYSDTKILDPIIFKSKNIDDAIIKVQNFFDCSYSWDIERVKELNKVIEVK